MKIDRYKEPKSSFLSAEKDMNILAEKICQNKRLQRLIYYTTPDALSRRNLNEDELLQLFQENIKIVPKLYVDETALNYVFLRTSQFRRNATNPEFRNNILEIDIVCHYDQWQLKDMQLRPYRIAGELDSMLDKEKLTGIGELEFIGADYININDEFGGLCLQYLAIHGEEDKKFMPNPADEKQFIKEFNEAFN